MIMEHADESVSWCGGACAGSARQQHGADGRTLFRTHAVRACGGLAHQSDLRSIQQYAMRAAAQGRQASEGTEQHEARSRNRNCSYINPDDEIVMVVVEGVAVVIKEQIK